MTRMQNGALPDVKLFSKCLGINDSTVETGAGVNLETGETELKIGHNVTITEEGKLISVPGLQEFVTFTQGGLVGISAGTSTGNSGRLIAQVGTGLFEYNSTSKTWEPIQRVIATVLAPVVLSSSAKVPIVHTNLDIRYTDGGVVYRVPNGSTTAVVAVARTYNGPATSRRYYAMPAFNGGFLVNGILYSWIGPHLQHSLPYYYDLWHLSDGRIGVESDILNAVGIPSCIVVLTADHVVVLVGGNPSNYRYDKYPDIKPIANTLVSAWSAKTESHIVMFLAEDGVYAVDQGKLVNLTTGRYDSSLKDCTFTEASISEGKYIAYGSPYCVEFDLKNKSVLHRDVLTERVITGSCVWGGLRLVSSDYSVWYDTGSNARQSSVIRIKFPCTDFGIRVKKRIRAFYISGEFVGEMTFTLHSDKSNSPGFSKVFTGKTDRVKVVNFWKKKGDFFAVEITFDGDYFRLDELLAVYDTTLGGE